MNHGFFLEYLSGRTRSNLIHRFGDTDGQQTVARNLSSSESPRLYQVGAEILQSPFPVLSLGLKTKIIGREKSWLGSINPDVAMCSPFLMVTAVKWRDGPTSPTPGKSVSIFFSVCCSRFTAGSIFRAEFFSRTTFAVGEGLRETKKRQTKKSNTLAREGTFRAETLLSPGAIGKGLAIGKHTRAGDAAKIEFGDRGSISETRSTHPRTHTQGSTRAAIVAARLTARPSAPGKNNTLRSPLERGDEEG